MAKLYILKDENSSRKEKMKFNLFLNGYDVTSLYCSGQLEGADIQAGVHQIVLTLHSQFASWRKPQTFEFSIAENEEVVFVIETSDALRLQKMVWNAQLLMVLWYFILRHVVAFLFQIFTPSAKTVISQINRIVFVLFAISMLVNGLLTMYLVLMQKQQTITEVSRSLVE